MDDEALLKAFECVEVDADEVQNGAEVDGGAEVGGSEIVARGDDCAIVTNKTELSMAELQIKNYRMFTLRTKLQTILHMQNKKASKRKML